MQFRIQLNFFLGIQESEKKINGSDFGRNFNDFAFLRVEIKF